MEGKRVKRGGRGFTEKKKNVDMRKRNGKDQESDKSSERRGKAQENQKEKATIMRSRSQRNRRMLNSKNST